MMCACELANLVAILCLNVNELSQMRGAGVGSDYLSARFLGRMLAVHKSFGIVDKIHERIRHAAANLLGAKMRVCVWRCVRVCMIRILQPNVRHVYACGDSASGNEREAEGGRLVLMNLTRY